MADKDTLFIQKAVHQKSGEEFDLSFIRECTLIETIDLSGPRLVLVLRDPENIVRDRVGVLPGHEIECTFADPWQMDGMDEKMKFRVMSMPLGGMDVVTMNCFQSDIEVLKIPAVRARMFARKPVGSIVREVLPGLKYDIGSFPAIEDYHILPGERPSWMLKQLAREQAAFAFFRRGTVCVKRKLDMFRQVAELEYVYNDFEAEYQIISRSKPAGEFVIQDHTTRHFVGWNMTRGEIAAAVHADSPNETAGSAHVPTLNNMAVVFRPAVEFVAAGNGALMPGIMLDLVWNTDQVDMPIDESLPDKALIGTVSHHYEPQKYFCRVKCIAPMEEMIRE